MPPKRAIKKAKVKTQTFYEPYRVSTHLGCQLVSSCARWLSVAAALMHASGHAQQRRPLAP